jgi:hypothetical protein
VTCWNVPGGDESRVRLHSLADPRFTNSQRFCRMQESIKCHPTMERGLLAYPAGDEQGYTELSREFVVDKFECPRRDLEKDQYCSRT